MVRLLVALVGLIFLMAFSLTSDSVHSIHLPGAFPVRGQGGWSWSLFLGSTGHGMQRQTIAGNIHVLTIAQ